jgi:hypothetical protein
MVPKSTYSNSLPAGTPTRQAGQTQPPRLERLADDMGRCFALGSEVGGQNDLLHRAVTGTVKQFFETNIVRPHTVQRD